MACSLLIVFVALGSNLEPGGRQNVTPKWQTSGRLELLKMEPQSATCLPPCGVILGSLWTPFCGSCDPLAAFLMVGCRFVVCLARLLSGDNVNPTQAMFGAGTC